LSTLLITAQHPEPYTKMGRMQVLYSFSLVEIEILDFQILLSRLTTAPWKGHRDKGHLWQRSHYMYPAFSWQ